MIHVVGCGMNEPHRHVTRGICRAIRQYQFQQAWRSFGDGESRSVGAVGGTMNFRTAEALAASIAATTAAIKSAGASAATSRSTPARSGARVCGGLNQLVVEGGACF